MLCMRKLAVEAPLNSSTSLSRCDHKSLDTTIKIQKHNIFPEEVLLKT